MKVVSPELRKFHRSINSPEMMENKILITTHKREQGNDTIYNVGKTCSVYGRTTSICTTGNECYSRCQLTEDSYT